MNYLELLDKKDIVNLLEKCNLQFDKKTDEPLRYSEDKKTAIIFCTKILYSSKDLAYNEILKKFKGKFNLSNFNSDIFSSDPVVLLTEFELIDSFNNQDYTNILFETLTNKLNGNEKLQKKYKKDFVKYHKKREKEVLALQKKSQKNHKENER